MLNEPTNTAPSRTLIQMPPSMEQLTLASLVRIEGLLERLVAYRAADDAKAQSLAYHQPTQERQGGRNKGR